MKSFQCISCCKQPILLIVCLIFTFSIFAQNSTLSFQFSIPNTCNTSAGVYKKNGQLIRTLWNGVRYQAGNYTYTWDGTDDEGLLRSDTGLIVKLLTNQVQYEWEGVIGNTSDSSQGSSVIRSYYRMQGMVIWDTFAYYCTGYNEGATASAKLNLKFPQQKINIMYHDYGTNLDIINVATDGRLVYWAGFDPNGGQYASTSKVSMVYATKVDGDSEFVFAKGVPVKMGTGITYKGAIDTLLNSDASLPTGLAVQRKGSYLFVAHGGLNAIHVFNKTTGEKIHTVSMKNPRGLAIDDSDQLWVIHDLNKVEKFKIDSATAQFSDTVLLSIKGLLAPLSVTVSPNNYKVLIIDAGASQQVKTYSNYSGDSLFTYGELGGYEHDPKVQSNKFYFSDTVSKIGNQFIAIAADSSYWISDGGNERILHFTHDWQYIDEIMYLPATYSTQVDRNNPTRAFNQFLEFEIDYSKPLAPKNGSWKLVRNWRHGVPSVYINLANISDVFQNAITLSNGRTYATLVDATNPLIHYPNLVELPDTGHVRFTGISFTEFSDDVIDADGTHRSYISANGDLSDSGFWYSSDLIGFDAVNNPIWNPSKKIASINALDKKAPAYDPIYGTISHPVKTSTNQLIVFNHSLNNCDHLGSVLLGDSDYLWRTSASTFTNTAAGSSDEYIGVFPKNGAYDLGNGVRVGGGGVYALERNIFWNYHGEFWRGSQTNIWNHVYDNGLLVAQFGVVLRDARVKVGEAPKMGAGNVFSSTIVKVDTCYYLYHNDESVHSGLHRWKITGLNTIKETVLPFHGVVSAGGLSVTHFSNIYLDNAGLTKHSIDSNVNLLRTKKTKPSSTRWKGFLSPAKSDNYIITLKSNKGIKLWIGHQLVIDSFNNQQITEWSFTAPLKGHSKYPLVIESNGDTVQFYWSSSTMSKQLIRSQYLYPDMERDESSEGQDLMEGLIFRTTLEANKYGWTRFPEKDIRNNELWRVNTNIRSFERTNPDVQINFRSSSSTRMLARSLKQIKPCMRSWKLNGLIDYSDNDPNVANAGFGLSFDVLDTAGRIISRITNERLFDGNTNPSQIKCNGKGVLEKSSDDLYLLSNQPQPFEIKADSSGLYFSYANYPFIKMNVMDSSSNWKQPAHLLFLLNTSNYYPNYDKAISVSKLRFFVDAPNPPQISSSLSNRICLGDSLQLSSSTATAYQWNTGELNNSIYVSKPGAYWVQVPANRTCQLVSDTFFVRVDSLPIARIAHQGDLVFCQGDSVSLSVTKSQMYLWSTGDTTATYTAYVSGIYYATITDSNACSAGSDSVQVVVLPLPATPFITVNGVLLSSSAPANNQWFYNDVLVPGATDMEFVMTENGRYSVRVMEDVCEAFSLPHLETKISSLTKGFNVNEILVYPNPTKGDLFLKLNSDELVEVQIINAQGAIVYKGLSNESKIDLHHLNKGMYTIQILMKQSVYQYKFALLP